MNSSNSNDDSQRLMRLRRDLVIADGDATGDDDNDAASHPTRRRLLRANGARNSKASSSSRFLEYRNATRTSSHHQHHPHFRLQNKSSSSPSRATCSPMTFLLIIFVVMAAAVGVLEWMYLDQFPMMRRHLPSNNRRVSSSSTANAAIIGDLFPNLRQQQQHQPPQQNNNNNNNNAGLLVAEQGEFPPESRMLDQPLEMVMQQLPHYMEEPQEEILVEDTNTDYVRDPDKEPILKILRQAGVDTDEIEKSVYDQLPTWSQVQELFGTKPVIYGMGEGEHGEENCAAFRNNTDPTIRFFGIAGMFNSGTNLLASLMIQNCQITERMLVYGEKSKGVRWQVPWGKHTPAKYRMEHLTRTDKDVPVSNSLPLITMRDPYQWMQSMCRHPYTVRGMHDELTCPHLIHTDFKPRAGVTITREDLSNIDVYYSNVIVRHATLAHFWNDWYHQYMQADFPRIFVRYEDLLFYAEEVTTKLCACGGGVPRRPEFMHIQNSAKVGHQAHGHVKTNLVEAMIRYGNFKHRLDRLTPLDIDIAKQLFDPKLMALFNYHHPNGAAAAAAGPRR